MQELHRVRKDGTYAMKSRPTVRWIVEDFLYAGSLAVLVGGPSSYKSYTMLDCGASIAAGKDWLGKKVAQGPVLIIDEDNDDRLMADRYASILRGHNFPETIPMYYICLGRYDLYDPKDIAELEAEIVETGAVLVVLDCLYKLLQNKSGNDAHNISPLFTILKDMAVRNQCSIVIVHHTNRNGGTSGSITIPGNSDIEVKVVRTRNTLKFTFEKHRRVNEKTAGFSAICEYPETMDTFKLVSKELVQSTDPRNTKTIAKAKSILSTSGNTAELETQVLTILADAKPATSSHIIEQCNGIDAKSVRNIISRLRTKGYITAVVGGSGRRAATYQISAAGLEVIDNM